MSIMVDQRRAHSRSSRRTGVPTLADVAQVAGVSSMTVSRALRHPLSVKQRTRDLVVAAAAQLRYTPNPAARLLAGANHCRIGVLCADLGAGFLNSVLVPCLSEANRLSMQVLIENVEATDDPVAMASNLLEAGVDGVLLPPPLGEHAGVIELLVQAGIPAVAVTASVPAEQLLAVHIDDERAAFAMTEHLIALGHRAIGLITGRSDLSASHRRVQGYRSALATHSIAVDEQLIVQGAFTYSSGLDAAEQLIALDQRPTAIFASNDDMAAATVAVAHRQGLDVPADLTVCGFDDTILATTIWPQLTTIRQPLAEMTRQAVAMLLERTDTSAALPLSDHREFAFELVRRQSDAAPRRMPRPLK